MVSSDDPEIQDVARSYGVEVPFTRPAELASDTASSSDVIVHAMGWFEARGERYDAVMLLEPSSPFTRPSDLDAAVELMNAKSATAVVGMRKMKVSSTFVGRMDDEGRITEIVDKMESLRSVRRQASEPEFTMNGALYLFRWDHFRAHRNIYADRLRTFGLVMPDAYSVEIDEPCDLNFAEFLVEKGQVDLSHWVGGDQHG